MRVLVIDHSPRAAAYLVRALGEANRVADLAPDVRTALVMLGDDVYDAVILERDAAAGQGAVTVAAIRRADPVVPLILVGTDDATERARCLRAGCDDYLPRPYAFIELDARLDGLVARRHALAPGARLQVGEMTLDLARREAFIGDRRIALSPREFLLLQRLARREDEVVSRAALVEAAWTFDFDPPDQLIDRQMGRLRQKLGEVSSHEWIEAVRGVGYRLRR